MSGKLRFGDRLRFAREMRGMSHGQLARRLGVGRTTIVMMETGDNGTTLRHFSRLCDILGVSADWLLGRTKGLTT